MSNRYRVLSYLQSGSTATVPAIADRLKVSRRTATVYLQHLELEGLVTLCPVPVTGVVALLTEAGLSYTVPEAERVENLMECGHPRTELTFCLPCRNRDRREFCRQNRTVLPVLRSQMRRIG